MIFAIQGVDLPQVPQWQDQLFRLRYAVFHERLKWDVTVEDGWERDHFDDCNPLYLLSVGADQQVRGALRLLPTTGPNMLRDVFPVLLDDEPALAAPTIWESTRFCVSQAASEQRSDNRLNYVTGELLAGIVEVGKLAGLSSVVSVYDARMRRVLRTAGCPADEIGTPKKIGSVTTYAGLFAIDDAMLERIRNAAGIMGPVLQATDYRLTVAAA